MKICIVATNGNSLTNFRGALIQSLAERGHEVVCVSIEPKAEMDKAIAALGATYVQVAGDRVSTGLLSGFKMIKDYRKCFDGLKPDICFLYMSKPIAFGGYAAIKEKVKHIHVLVNGLENAYYQHGLRDWAIRRIMTFFYRKVCRSAETVFMQNKDDLAYFVDHHIASPEKLKLVHGSGVDMAYFQKEDMPEAPVFLMVARLLWSKGIREYLEAIAIIKEKCPEARFMLLGGLDESKEALTEIELEDCIEKYDIEYCGYSADVRPFLKKCSVLVLPSYHEGTPRSVLEAMATGRAIITSDAPGCRETVVENKNGFLVPVGDSRALAEKMMILAKDGDLRRRMGEASYQICKDKFEVNKVNLSMMDRMI